MKNNKRHKVNNLRNPIACDPYFTYLLQYLTTWQIISKMALLSKWHYDHLKLRGIQKVMVNLVKREFGNQIFQQTSTDAKTLYLQCRGSTFPPDDEPYVWLPNKHCSEYILGQPKTTHPKCNTFGNPYTLIADLYKPMLYFHDQFERKVDNQGLEKQILVPSWINRDNIISCNYWDVPSLYEHPHLRTMFFNKSFAALKSILFKLIGDNSNLSIFREKSSSFSISCIWNTFVCPNANLSSLISEMFETLSKYVINKSTLAYENIFLKQFLLDNDGIDKDMIHQKWPENALSNFKIAYYGAVDITIEDNDENGGKSRVWNGVKWNENSQFVDNNVYDLYHFGKSSIVLLLNINNDIMFLSNLFVSCMEYGASLVTRSPNFFFQNNRYYFHFDYWQWILQILMWYHTKECAAQEFGFEVDRLQYSTFDYSIQLSQSFVKGLFLPYFKQGFNSTIAMLKARIQHDNDGSGTVALDVIEKMFLHKIILVAFVLGDLRWQQCDNIQAFTQLRDEIEQRLKLNGHEFSNASYSKTKKEYQFIDQITKKMENEFSQGFTALQQVWKDNLVGIGQVISDHVGNKFDFGSFFMTTVEKTKKLGNRPGWLEDDLLAGEELDVHMQQFLPSDYLVKGKQII